jgi:hypothetical protein
MFFDNKSVNLFEIPEREARRVGTVASAAGWDFRVTNCRITPTKSDESD